MVCLFSTHFFVPKTLGVFFEFRGCSVLAALCRARMLSKHQIHLYRSSARTGARRLPGREVEGPKPTHHKANDNYLWFQSNLRNFSHGECRWHCQVGLGVEASQHIHVSSSNPTKQWECTQIFTVDVDRCFCSCQLATQATCILWSRLQARVTENS